MSLVVRNDVTGLWDFKTLAKAIPPQPVEPKTASFIKMDSVQAPLAADIVRSFVRVSVTVPLKLDGYPSTKDTSFGLVIDAEQGLVIVSRSAVPYSMCDISVTIADSILVDGKVVFLHPLQNYAIIQYDPKLVNAPVKTAKLSTKTIKQGEPTVFFGYNQNHRPVIVKTAVTDITSVTIPASMTMPRYRATNLDAITVDSTISERCASGVLVAEDGTVQALWLSYLGDRTSNGRDNVYRLGLGTPALLPVIEEIRSGRKPDLRIMNMETQVMQMVEARIHGVSQEWIERIEREDPERHQCFMIRKLDAGNTGGLAEGDVVLTLNGKLVTRVTDFDVMYNAEKLDVVVVRKREEIRLSVPTVLTSDLETSRAVIFCGAVLHAPHFAVRQQISKLHSKIYVSSRLPGSPAYMYGLAPTNFITHVNGVPTNDLDEFVKETNKIPDNTYFRLKIMTFDNQPWVATMKKCEHYYPSQEFIMDASQREGWRRIIYENGKVKVGEGDIPDGPEETTVGEDAMVE